jgi:hypothetical protein
MTQDIIQKIDRILKHPKAYSAETLLAARQWLILQTPLSSVVEMYLHDNEGRIQNLAKFKMMRAIYDQLPQRLLLKCSRKTLKSTLLSNIIALNMIRYNHYKMLYVAPQEIATKYFSTNYLNVRLDSPPLKKIIYKGFEKCDVFEKILEDTHSAILLRYAKDDATRIRGPAVDSCIYDEIQDIDDDILPIIKETMTLSQYKREMFAGTPLTTDNTINVLWKASTQFEWVFKCTACNHWNSLTLENDPMKMIQKNGLSCSKCLGLVSSADGEWVSANPGDRELAGYHIAQPILPFFNEDAKEWKEIYNKIHGVSKYSVGKVHNEVFGLAYDTGKKPITEEKLKSLSILGSQDSIFQKNRSRYMSITCGVDWGVNLETSRTSVCIGGLRDDGVYEVFFLKIFKEYDYMWQIRNIAQHVMLYGAFCACDSGPDPIRGVLLAQQTSLDKTQLVRYTADKFIQHYDKYANAIDVTQNRWCLHRSDTLTFTYNLLNDSKILFPRWEESSECLSDILNVYIELREGTLRREILYRHSPDKPDDFMHALNFAVVQAHTACGNPLLFRSSSSDPMAE